MRGRNEPLAIGICFFGHECIIIIARRMALRKIQTLKHMKLVINLTRLFRNIPHAVENIRDVFDLAHQRMNRAVVTRK